ncbi:hypothetical protein V2G26_001134 [Clonostachys chloroleuca]
MIQVTAQAGHRTGIMKNTGGVLRKNLGEKLSLTQAVSDLLNPRITIFRVLDISRFVTNRTRKAKIRRRWARSDLDLPTDVNQVKLGDACRRRFREKSIEERMEDGVTRRKSSTLALSSRSHRNSRITFCGGESQTALARSN